MENNLPELSPGQTISLQSLTLIASPLVFPTVAVAGEDRLPVKDYPFTHPAVVKVENGWNGFAYWAAITPYIYADDASAKWENVHIFCSHDGIEWLEPTGIKNPIEPAPAGAGKHIYWSDPHLEYNENDNCLYCFFRGYNIPVEQSGSKAPRVIVYKKSASGIDWDPVSLLYDSLSGGRRISHKNEFLSPAVFRDQNQWHIYDVLKGKHARHQKRYAVSHRKAGDLTSQELRRFKRKNYISLKKSLGRGNYIWHIDARKIGNITFILACTRGKTSNFVLRMLYSTDGKKFDIVPGVILRDAYRSALLFKEARDNHIRFWIYRAQFSTCQINVYEAVFSLDQAV